MSPDSDSDTAPRDSPWRPVDLEDSAPAYRQVADQIRAAIHNGHLPPGTRLPSEPELEAHCAISRTTSRRAVQTLRDEGLVVTRHGTGSFVHISNPTACTTSPCTSDQHTHAYVQARMPSPDEQTRLDIGPEVPVIVITRPAAPGDDQPPHELVLPANRTRLLYIVNDPNADMPGWGWI